MVLGHIADGYLKAGSFPASADVLGWVFNAIYSFHMPLFFAISGYVYRAAYFDEEQHMVKRRVFQQIGNLLAVYILFSVCFGAFKIVCGRFANSDVSASDLLLIGVRAISPYWYIYVLIQFYLLFSLTGFSRASAAGMFGCAVVACVLSMFVGGDTLFEIKKSLYYLLFFCGGYSKAGREDGGKPLVTVVAFCVAVALCAVFWNDARSIHRIPVVNMLVASGIVWMIWYGFEHIHVLGDNRLLQKVGGVSMEIYVLHCIFTAGNRVLLPLLGLHDVYVCIAVNFMISLCVPVAAAVLSRKLGIHDLLFKPVTFITKRRAKGDPA